MSSLFQIEDLFNVLITLEQAGQKQYSEMSKHAEDFTVKALFEKLAQEEVKHEQLYSKLKNASLHISTDKITVEYKQYALQLIGDTVTFLNRLSPVTTIKEGIAVGLKLEKETIFMLNELKTVLDEAHHSLVDDIIQKEKEHIQLLLSL